MCVFAFLPLGIRMLEKTMPRFWIHENAGLGLARWLPVHLNDGTVSNGHSRNFTKPFMTSPNDFGLYFSKLS